MLCLICQTQITQHLHTHLLIAPSTSKSLVVDRMVGQSQDFMKEQPLQEFKSTYIPTYLPSYLPANLPTYLPTYLPAYLPTYLHR